MTPVRATSSARYLLPGILALAGVGCVVAAFFLPPAYRVSLVIIGNLLWLAAFTALAYPLLRDLQERSAAVSAQLASLLELREIFQQAPAIVKEYRRARVATEALRDSVEAQRAPIDAAAKELRDGLFRLRALEDDLQQTRLESEERLQQAQRWVESAIGYFEYLQRVLQQLPPEDARRALFAQQADTFAYYAAAQGLDRILPSPGDAYLPGLHQVVGEELRADLPPGAIARCERWGYRLGGKVLHPATVILVSPPEHASGCREI